MAHQDRLVIRKEQKLTDYTYYSGCCIEVTLAITVAGTSILDLSQWHSDEILHRRRLVHRMENYVGMLIIFMLKQYYYWLFNSGIKLLHKYSLVCKSSFIMTCNEEMSLFCGVVHPYIYVQWYSNALKCLSISHK